MSSLDKISHAVHFYHGGIETLDNKNVHTMEIQFRNVDNHEAD